MLFFFTFSLLLPAPAETEETTLDVESRLLLELCESRKVLIEMYCKLTEYSQQSVDSKVSHLDIMVEQ